MTASLASTWPPDHQKFRHNNHLGKLSLLPGPLLLQVLDLLVEVLHLCVIPGDGEWLVLALGDILLQELLHAGLQLQVPMARLPLRGPVHTTQVLQA